MNKQNINELKITLRRMIDKYDISSMFDELVDELLVLINEIVENKNIEIRENKCKFDREIVDLKYKLSGLQPKRK